MSAGIVRGLQALRTDHRALSETYPEAEFLGRASDADLAERATQLGIRAEQFIADIQSEKIGQRVQEDFMSGVRSGVNGTPTFFINGVRYDDSWDYADLVTAITASMPDRVSATGRG